MIESIGKLYRKQLFQPSFPLGLFINDFYIARRGLFKFVKNNSGFIKGHVLDIGCGLKPYRDLFDSKKYIGIDVENEGHSHKKEDIDFFYDGKIIPFENNSYDNAVCFEVLEHVFDPDLFLLEIKRVLKPDGHLLLTTPFIWNEHEIPNDYGRYSSYGLKYLLEKNGFELVKLVKILNGPEFLIVLLQVYLNDFRSWLSEKLSFIPQVKWIIFLIFLPIIFIFNLVGFIFSFFFRDNRFYFNNGVVATKKVSTP